MYCTASKTLSLTEKGKSLTITKEMVELQIPFFVDETTFFTRYIATTEQHSLPLHRYQGSDSEALEKIEAYIKRRTAERDQILAKQEAMFEKGGYDSIRAEKMKIPALPEWENLGLILPIPGKTRKQRVDA